MNEQVCTLERSTTRWSYVSDGMDTVSKRARARRDVSTVTITCARDGRAHHVQLSCAGSQGAVAALRAGWGVGCLNEAAIPPDLACLSRSDARHWPSPGKLAFYLHHCPGLQATATALLAWSK